MANSRELSPANGTERLRRTTSQLIGYAVVCCNNGSADGRKQPMSMSGKSMFAAVLLFTLCLTGCQETELDDAAKARLAAEEAAAEGLKQTIGEEKYKELQSDGDEDGKGLPPHAVFSKMEQAKRARGGSNRP